MRSRPGGEGMMSTQHGYFLIADITGYTQYLSESELDHAQSILSSLLNLLIQHTKPPLIISRLAGDAVISYGLSDNFLTGQTFAESIEDTYVSFRRMVELMVHNTTCPCNACQNIKSLDLKFFVHYGEFAVQKLDAHDELVGSDVNLLHRLLKNHVTETTTWKAYTLYSDAAIHQLGLENLSGLVRLEESYEHLGTVTVWIEDMHPVWDRKKKQAQVLIAPADELISASIDIALRPELVWDYLLQPEHYNVLVNATRIEIEKRPGDRITAGSVFQCYHGEGMVPLTIIEWQPFERMVSQFPVPVPFKGTTGLSEIRLEPIEGGTRLSQIMGKTKGPVLGRLMGDREFKKMEPKFREDLARFKAHIEADWAALTGGGPVQVTIADERIRAAARESLIAV
jgi:hypothetical protein